MKPTSRAIVVNFIYPPIGTREFDYEATYEDYDGEGPIGYGRDEESAIDDLCSRDDER